MTFQKVSISQQVGGRFKWLVIVQIYSLGLDLTYTPWCSPYCRHACAHSFFASFDLRQWHSCLASRFFHHSTSNNIIRCFNFPLRWTLQKYIISLTHLANASYINLAKVMSVRAFTSWAGSIAFECIFGCHGVFLDILHTVLLLIFIDLVD